MFKGFGALWGLVFRGLGCRVSGAVICTGASFQPAAGAGALLSPADNQLRFVLRLASVRRCMRLAMPEPQRERCTSACDRSLSLPPSAVKYLNPKPKGFC